MTWSSWKVNFKVVAIKNMKSYCIWTGVQYSGSTRVEKRYHLINHHVFLFSFGQVAHINVGGVHHFSINHAILVEKLHHKLWKNRWSYFPLKWIFLQRCRSMETSWNPECWPLRCCGCRTCRSKRCSWRHTFLRCCIESLWCKRSGGAVRKSTARRSWSTQ